MVIRVLAHVCVCACPCEDLTYWFQPEALMTGTAVQNGHYQLNDRRLTVGLGKPRLC
jgi:hypothetical protein